MGDINIKIAEVKAETDEIKKYINNNILQINQQSVKQIKTDMKESKGKTVKALQNQLDKEEQLVNSIGDLLNDIAEYMSIACDDFERLDSKYAKTKVEN